jgi:hypothetical protein
LSNPTALGHVFEDVDHLLIGQAAVEQGRAGPLAEALGASLTAEHPAGAIRAVAERHPQVAMATPAVLGAVRIQATETG